MGNKHLNTKNKIQSAEITTSAWVDDNKPKVNAVITIQLQADLDAYADFRLYATVGEIHALIANLHQHIIDIGACENQLAEQSKQVLTA